MKIVLLLCSLFISSVALALPRGAYYSGDIFTGRSNLGCEAAYLQAVAQKDRYCRNVSRNYTCGNFIETDRGSKGNRCAVRGKVLLTPKKR